MIEDKVHYIWVGPLTDSKQKIACSLGPISLAKLDRAAVISVWVPRASGDDAVALFRDYPNIQIKFVEDALNRIQHDDDEVKPELNAAYADPRIPDVAKKDMLTHVILYEEGGYFFDTSTEFTAKPDLPRFGPNEYRLEMERGILESSQSEPLIWTRPDVWACGSAANSKILELALFSDMITVQTANHQPSTIAGPMFTDGMKYGLDQLLNGGKFYQFKQADLQPTPEQMLKLREVCWIRDNTGPASNPFGHRISQLNLNKYNLGLWRDDRDARAVVTNKKGLYNHVRIELPPRAKFLDELDELKKRLPANTPPEDTSLRVLNQLISLVEAERINVNTPLSKNYSHEEIMKFLIENLKLGQLMLIVEASNGKSLTQLIESMMQSQATAKLSTTTVTSELEAWEPDQAHGEIEVTEGLPAPAVPPPADTNTYRAAMKRGREEATGSNEEQERVNINSFDG